MIQELEDLVGNTVNGNGPDHLVPMTSPGLAVMIYVCVDNAMFCTEGPGLFGIRRTEDGNHGHADRGGHVHGTGIYGHNKIHPLDYASEHWKGRFPAQIMHAPARRLDLVTNIPVLGTAGNVKCRPQFTNQPLPELGKTVGRPIFRRPSRTRNEQDSGVIRVDRGLRKRHREPLFAIWSTQESGAIECLKNRVPATIGRAWYIVVEQPGTFPVIGWSQRPVGPRGGDNECTFHEALEINRKIVPFRAHILEERTHLSKSGLPVKQQDSIHIRKASDQIFVLRLRNPVDARVQMAPYRMYGGQGVKQVSQ